MGRLERFEAEEQRKERVARMNRIQAERAEEDRARRDESFRQARTSAVKAFRWARAHPASTGVIISLVFLLFGAIGLANMEATKQAEVERIQAEKVEAAEEAAALEFEAAEEAAALEFEQAKQAEQEAKAAEHLAVYGISETDFNKQCQTLVTQYSGSNDFGVFNDPGNSLFPDLGSMVTQKAVYGKNVFGAKVEEVYKCWSEPSGSVEAELIGSSIK